jgi:hypothetical protein
MASRLSYLARVATMIAFVSPALAAQTAAAPRPFCFTPDISAHCTRFLLLEGNVTSMYAASPRDYNATQWSANWGLGAMQNLDARTAVGGAVTYGFNGTDGSRTTVELRAIHWLSGRMALEGSAGFPRLNLYPTVANGGTAGMALTYRDLIGVSANLQTVRVGKQESGLLVGGRTGGWVTAIATGAAAIVGGVGAYAIGEGLSHMKD